MVSRLIEAPLPKIVSKTVQLITNGNVELRLIGDRQLLATEYKTNIEALREAKPNLPEIDGLVYPIFQFTKRPMADRKYLLERQNYIIKRLEDLGCVVGCGIQTPHFVVVDVDVTVDNGILELFARALSTLPIFRTVSLDHLKKMVQWAIAHATIYRLNVMGHEQPIAFTFRGFHYMFKVKEPVYAKGVIETGYPVGRIIQNIREEGDLALRLPLFGPAIFNGKCTSEYEEGENAVPLSLYMLNGRAKIRIEIFSGANKILPCYNRVLKAIMLPEVHIIAPLSKELWMPFYVLGLIDIGLAELARHGDLPLYKTDGSSIDELILKYLRNIRETVSVKDTDILADGQCSLFEVALKDERTVKDILEARLENGVFIGNLEFSPYSDKELSLDDAKEYINKVLEGFGVYCTDCFDLVVLKKWEPSGKQELDRTEWIKLVQLKQLEIGDLDKARALSLITASRRAVDLLRSLADTAGIQCLKELLNGRIRKGYRFRALALLLDILGIANLELTSEDAYDLCELGRNWENGEEWFHECINTKIRYLLPTLGLDSSIVKYPYFGVKLAREAITNNSGGKVDSMYVTFVDIVAHYTGQNSDSICSRCIHGLRGRYCLLRYKDIRKAVEWLARQLRNMVSVELLAKAVV